MIIATFGQALSGEAPAVTIIGVIIVWRFIVNSSMFHHPHFLTTAFSDGRRNWR